MTLKNLPQMATEFELSLKALNRASRTRSEIMRKLNRFFNYLKTMNINHADGITREVVHNYQIEICQCLTAKGAPYTIPHQNSMMCAVKQFITFLRSADYIVSNPARDLQYARPPQKLPQSILTPGEVRKLMQVPDTKSILGYRDRTILEILYSSGMRKTELRTLTLNDVDYHDGFILVTGKGRRERVVPIGRIACRYLENYITAVRPELVKNPCDITLFLSIRGKIMNHDAVRRLIKKYAKQAHIHKNVHCHTLRHSCATAMLKNKADIRTIQEILGHVHITTTQVYTRINITDLKEVHARCHPRERDES